MIILTMLTPSIDQKNLVLSLLITHYFVLLNILTSLNFPKILEENLKVLNHEIGKLKEKETSYVIIPEDTTVKENYLKTIKPGVLKGWV